MTKYLKNKFIPLLLLTTAISCTAVDNFFGNNLIPPSQAMDTYIDSSMTVRTSIFKVDSMVGNLAKMGFLGSVIDPMVGRTTLGFLTNYIPYQFTNKDSLFGIDPTLDSMILTLNFTTHIGDTLQDMRVSVYEIKDSVLNYDHKYYLDMNPELYYDANAQPLVEFVVRGEKLKKVHLPRHFFEKFLIEGPKNEAEKKTNPYYQDSLWIKKFNGLYFKTEHITSGKGQIASIDLGSNSLISLYYHNKNPWKYDTIRHSYALSPLNTNNKMRYTTATATSSHDYSFSNQAAGGVNPAFINDPTVEVSTVYIQGFNGLGAKVVLDTAHLSTIRAKAAANNFNAIAVHRAVLRWKLIEKTAVNYDASFKRIGLYYSFTKSDFIADYNPAFQDNNSGQDLNPIGGSIDRSNGYYEQVITSTIQKLISQKNTKNTIELLPIWGEAFGWQRTILGGSKSTDYAPEMVITYTLLR